MVSQGKPKFAKCDGLQTTIVCTHVLHNGPWGVKSPGKSM